MDMSDATEGAPFWQLHIAAWQQSGLTQKAYCEHQELRYSTFGYWVRKLRRAAKPATEKKGAGQACLRPRDRFWDIPVPKIDSAFDNLLVPQPSWSPSTTQQLRKLVAAPYLAPI
ncbi:IS66 family insertion sequence element accessory protein TnpA [Thiolapillus sp.]|uniref:IS66 family insertion sequence element accessory protein TnpA n=2 Tax=Thiolapillus sp. TaxID=2017437 RepID=UPI003AF77052